MLRGLLSICVHLFLINCLNAMSNIAVREEKIEKKITTMLEDFLGYNLNSISITQLKDGVVNCYNNTDYKVKADGKKYFVKVANPNGKLLCTSIQNEMDCAAIAYKAGISPKILMYDSKESIMIAEFVDVKEEFTFKKPMAKERWVTLLHKLHDLDEQFPLKFSPFDTIHHYVENALERGVELPNLLIEEILPKIDAFNKEALFLKSVPCHLDPASGNILDGGENLYLVDWECAAMCDPFFDLATMAAWEDFSDEEMFEILALYLKRSPLDEEFKRLYHMRILADLRFGTYCYLQTKVSSTRNDLYRKFADEYLKLVIKRLITI